MTTFETPLETAVRELVAAAGELARSVTPSTLTTRVIVAKGQVLMALEAASAPAAGTEVPREIAEAIDDVLKGPLLNREPYRLFVTRRKRLDEAIVAALNARATGTRAEQVPISPESQAMLTTGIAQAAAGQLQRLDPERLSDDPARTEPSEAEVERLVRVGRDAVHRAHETRDRNRNHTTDDVDRALVIAVRDAVLAALPPRGPSAMEVAHLVTIDEQPGMPEWSGVSICGVPLLAFRTEHAHRLAADLRRALAAALPPRGPGEAAIEERDRYKAALTQIVESVRGTDPYVREQQVSAIACDALRRKRESGT